MSTFLRLLLIAFAATTVVGEVRGAVMFTPVFSGGAFDVQASLQVAPRWSSVSGLSDGIQVAVMPGFAESLGANTPDLVTLVDNTISNSFAAWENSALHFQVTFNGAVARGASAGSEIDLFTVPAFDVVITSPSLFAITYANWQFFADRPLTNGQAFDGNAITGADIFVNIDKVANFSQSLGLTLSQQMAALQRLLMHEIGHSIGLDHPNRNPTLNLDQDNNPFNPMLINGADPFAGIIASPIVDDNVVMSNSPSDLFNALFRTTLTNDDLGGRDLLYPVVPEPSTIALATCGALFLLASRRTVLKRRA